MQQKLAAFLVTLLVPLALNAQDPECPKLQVIGPQGIMTPKEPATFVLQMDRDHPELYRYEWTVENGVVTKGQGTRVAEVTTLLWGTNVKATATVSGFPDGCPSTASEIVGVVQAPEWHIVDEWGEMPSDDQRGRLDVFFLELSNNPAQKGLIIVGARTKQIQQRRLKLVLDHARFRKFDQDRLVFCVETWTGTSTRLYRFYPSFLAEFPYPGCTPVAGKILLKQIASRK